MAYEYNEKHERIFQGIFAIVLVCGSFFISVKGTLAFLGIVYLLWMFSAIFAEAAISKYKHSVFDSIKDEIHEAGNNDGQITLGAIKRILDAHPHCGKGLITHPIKTLKSNTSNAYYDSDDNWGGSSISIQKLEEYLPLEELRLSHAISGTLPFLIENKCKEVLFMLSLIYAATLFGAGFPL